MRRLILVALVVGLTSGSAHATRLAAAGPYLDIGSLFVLLGPGVPGVLPGGGVFGGPGEGGGGAIVVDPPAVGNPVIYDPFDPGQPMPLPTKFQLQSAGSSDGSPPPPPPPPPPPCVF